MHKAIVTMYKHMMLILLLHWCCWYLYAGTCFCYSIKRKQGQDMRKLNGH